VSPDRGTPFPLDDDSDPIVRRLRQALAQEAEMVHPDQNGLEEITRRTSDTRRRPWAPWLAGLAAAAVAAVVVGVAVTQTGGNNQPVAAPSPSASASEPSGTGSPTGSPTGTTTAPAPEPLSGIPVYWVGQSKTRPWLYREFRDVPDAGGAVASAVAAMTREAPLDPDYSTPWKPASRVEVTQSGEALTVDLSADAFSGTQVGSELAALAVQQLVYTATAAAQVAGTPASTVTITVDGQPYDAWGVVRVGQPTQRAQLSDVQAPTWVLSPSEGATVPAGAVAFTGYGTAFEATFLWEVRTASGHVVADGNTMGGSMGTYGDFSFTADLAPGDYTVEVYQPDESGGESDEGPRMFPDTKGFTVR
jgi:Immunoglobulin-like domain of bacterial spore germination/Sporulation and spore germination